jgi:hypothetical protein
LKGDMSVVGLRPEVTFFVQEFRQEMVLLVGFKSMVYVEATHPSPNSVRPLVSSQLEHGVRCGDRKRIDWHPHPSWLRNPLLAPSVTFSMAAGAECNQILRHVPAELASGLEVMNLQLLRGAAVLAPPTISF